MPKPDSYNGIRLISGAERITLPNGKFIGFLNGTGSQEINIRGELIYNGLTREAVNGITFVAAANAYIPVECTSLRPASFNIIGYF